MDHIYEELKAALFSTWHRRWLALAVAWGVCVVGWAVVAMMPNYFESHGRIYVQLYDPIAQQMGLGGDDRQHDIERVRDTLTSAVHLAKVIHQTRLGDGITSQRQLDNAVAALAKNVRVSNQQDNLFEISATAGSLALSDRENAALARDIVEKMIDIFHAENTVGKAGEVADAGHFVDQQLAQRSQELATAEQRRAQFDAAHPELAQGGVSLVQQLEQVRNEQRALDSDIAAAQSSLAAINGQIAATPQSLSGATTGARAALAQAEAQFAALRARGLTDDHPDIIALRNEITALRAQAVGEASSGVSAGVPNPAYAGLIAERADHQANLQALLARRTALQADAGHMAALQNANPALVAEAQSISRDYDVLKQQYDKLLQDREDLRLKGQVENAHDSVKFQVIDPPTLPRAPAAPNRQLLLIMVLVVGLAAGVGVAFAVGEFRATFATTAKLARGTGLAVLGAISLVPSAATQRARTREIKAFLAAAGALGGVFLLLMASEYLQRSTLS